MAPHACWEQARKQTASEVCHGIKERVSGKTGSPTPSVERQSTHQGLRILLADGSRLVCRLSGTGTAGATLRLYVERYRTDGGQVAIDVVLAPLVQAAVHLLELPECCGRYAATVVT